MSATIRLATEHDAAAMLDIYAPVIRDTAISFESAPPTEHEFRERIRQCLLKWPWLACELGGRVAGYAYATTFRPRTAYDWTAESAIYVHSDFRSQGVGRGLYTSLFACLRLMGIVNVFAGTTLPNEASVGLHRACGFTPAGLSHKIGFKFGKWHDVAWWECVLGEHAVPPAPLMALSELIGTPAWAEALQTGVATMPSR